MTTQTTAISAMVLRFRIPADLESLDMRLCDADSESGCAGRRSRLGAADKSLPRPLGRCRALDRGLLRRCGRPRYARWRWQLGQHPVGDCPVESGNSAM